jgi:predicted RNA-binding protein
MASAVIIDTDSHKAKRVKTVGYPISEIIYKTRTVKVDEILPFRVKFTTIGIGAAYSNVPGIGLQIIGINNYIL